MDIAKPQALLDEIHQTGIFQEDWHGYPTEQSRADKIRFYRRQFHQINRQLKHEAYQAKLTYGEAYLAPYELIRRVLQEISLWLKMIEAGDLDVYLDYGTTILGDINTNTWKIGDKATALKWEFRDTAQKLKQSLRTIEAQLKHDRRHLKWQNFGLFLGMGCLPICILLIPGLNMNPNIVIRTLPYSIMILIIAHFLTYESKTKAIKTEIHQLQKLKKQLKDGLAQLKQDYQQLPKV